jgi:beta-1,2-mannobiose phosphorylase / 1,2-beta-oligomannan phosphorylase
MLQRFASNPLITTKDIKPSQDNWEVLSVLNPGVFEFDGKIWLLLRVAERPIQKDNFVSFPILTEEGAYEIKEYLKTDPKLDLSDVRMVGYEDKMYLSTISHLRLVCSDDGYSFYEPEDIPTKIYGHGSLETFGIEDCRVSQIDGTYYLTFTQVSEQGVGVGMMHTKDWLTFQREGMIIPPHNKDCALFEEKINGKYYCFHRPSGIGLGGNFIWISSSPDLIHWGNHQCIIQTRPGMWDSARVGAGAAPIKTDKGWLAIYHGATCDHRYCLGAILLDIEDPTKVIARSIKPIMEPTTDYEINGFFGQVIFTNGHIVKGDEITVYYGASDEVICGVNLSVNDILNSLNV